MSELHGYQRFAIQRIVRQSNIGLFLEMGLGKTVVTLSAIEELLVRGLVHKVLVIAPLRVAQTVWAEEVMKWPHLAELRCSKVLGTAKERLAGLARDADIYIINRENTEWLVGVCGAQWPFDMVVLDELSSFKSRTARRFRALRRVRGKISRVVGLTGTPAPNGLLDLWAQVYLLDRGAALGPTLGGYRERYFSPGRRNGAIVYDWVLKPGAAQAIYRRLEGLCISMRSEDYLELPDQLVHDVQVELSSRARGVYVQMERDALIELKGTVITASTAAVVAGKLLQLANGAVYSDAGYQEVHDCKLDALGELIEAAQGQPVLVYYAYRHDLDRIKRAFPGARELRTDKDIAEWNAGQIGLLLAHPDSAGHGLNLQDGGHLIVWFGLTWSLEKYLQANARLHRQGQLRPVVIYRLIARDTIDETVVQVLDGKERGQDALMAAVLARVEGL